MNSSVPHIAVISASIRDGRKSHRVALYLSSLIKESGVGTAEILDLDQYQFPLFTERIKFLKDPSDEVLSFAEKVRTASGVIVVTPEYNGGYPASLKNVIDLLYDEWQKKPIAIATVSDGSFGGSQVIISLVFTFWKIRAWVVPAMLPIANVGDSFDEMGKALSENIQSRARKFLSELVWCVTAKDLMSHASEKPA